MDINPEIKGNFSKEQAGWILGLIWDLAFACDPKAEVSVPVSQNHIADEAQRQWDQKNPTRWK